MVRTADTLYGFATTDAKQKFFAKLLASCSAIRKMHFPKYNAFALGEWESGMHLLVHTDDIRMFTKVNSKFISE
jgi:hypothetical protein